MHDVRNKVSNDAGATGVKGSQDLMARMAANKNLRGFQTSAALPFHTDGCDLFMLMCLHQGCRGGKTSIVSAVEGFNRILKADPSLALELQQPFYFDARGQRSDGEKCQVSNISTLFAQRWVCMLKCACVYYISMHMLHARLCSNNHRSFRCIRYSISTPGV